MSVTATAMIVFPLGTGHGEHIAVERAAVRSFVLDKQRAELRAPEAHAAWCQGQLIDTVFANVTVNHRLEVAMKLGITPTVSLLLESVAATLDAQLAQAGVSAHTRAAIACACAALHRGTTTSV